MNMTDKYYIGWVRSGKDGKGPRKVLTAQADSQCRDDNGRERYCRPSRRTGKHHTAYSI